MRKSILIFLFALLGILSAHAYDFEVGGIYYNILSGTSDKVEVTNSGDEASYTGSVVIPSTVTYNGNTYTVTSIGDYAFYYCRGLTSVTIPEGVTTIGQNAFRGTAISSPLYNSRVFAYMPTDYSGDYTIPSGIESIASGAFYECSALTSVTIPESVTSIGVSAFASCSGLTSVTIPNSVTSINWFVFEGCSGLTSVTIPNSVTSIGESAFYDCSSLTSVTIPESVTSIGYFAFGDCSGLTSVTIPNSVTYIEGRAFYYCSGLTSVTSLAKTPPYCNGSVFSVHDTLFVPRGSKEAYQSAPVWRDFAKIEEISGAGTATVKAQVNDAAMGRATGDGEYELDEEITLKAIPNPGYHFEKWDDGSTDNPRLLTVTEDITLTAIFAKGDPTANENAEADNFGVYVQNRTIYLSEDRGLVQVYNVAGQCIYNGHATAIPVQQPGVYILRADGRSRKIIVR